MECYRESILKQSGFLWGSYIHSDLHECYYFGPWWKEVWCSPSFDLKDPSNEHVWSYQLSPFMQRRPGWGVSLLFFPKSFVRNISGSFSADFLRFNIAAESLHYHLAVLLSHGSSVGCNLFFLWVTRPHSPFKPDANGLWSANTLTSLILGQEVSPGDSSLVCTPELFLKAHAS